MKIPIPQLRLNRRVSQLQVFQLPQVVQQERQILNQGTRQLLASNFPQMIQKERQILQLRLGTMTLPPILEILRATRSPKTLDSIMTPLMLEILRVIRSPKTQDNIKIPKLSTRLPRLLEMTIHLLMFRMAAMLVPSLRPVIRQKEVLLEGLGETHPKINPRVKDRSMKERLLQTPLTRIRASKDRMSKRLQGTKFLYRTLEISSTTLLAPPHNRIITPNPPSQFSPSLLKHSHLIPLVFKLKIRQSCQDQLRSSSQELQYHWHHLVGSWLLEALLLSWPLPW